MVLPPVLLENTLLFTTSMLAAACPVPTVTIEPSTAGDHIASMGAKGQPVYAFTIVNGRHAAAGCIEYQRALGNSTRVPRTCPARTVLRLDGLRIHVDSTLPSGSGGVRLRFQSLQLQP